MINEINVNGGKIVGDKNIANKFNKYFSEIGKKLASEIPQNDMDPLYLVITVSNTFTSKSIPKEDLCHAISCMKANRSASIDKISVRLIQGAGSTISKSLHYIFNLSINTGMFPDDWKIARAMPIYKFDYKAECGNYRPISVLSNVA